MFRSFTIFQKMIKLFTGNKSMSKIKNIMFSLALLFFIIPSTSAVAATMNTDTSPTHSKSCTDPKLTKTEQNSCSCFGVSGYDVSDADLKKCSSCNQTNPTADSLNNCLSQNRIVTRINDVIKILSGLVAIVITGSIIYGGFQYVIGGDVAEHVQAGKKRIIRSMVALILFFLIFSFLQWVIPGGIFN